MLVASMGRCRQPLVEKNAAWKLAAPVIASLHVRAASTQLETTLDTNPARLDSIFTIIIPGAAYRLLRPPFGYIDQPAEAAEEPGCCGGASVRRR